ncbi:MAG: hypothetical protein DPW09_23575 [Anaerolineae bacterium]|nr:hypothetical protein [Anaerolineales bacterium]MCQ3976422.1 hypothetical protein [Anaerolineae bacterium]
MRTSHRRNLVKEIRYYALFSLVLFLLVLLMPGPAYAASPTIIIGIVGTNGCVTGITKRFDLDTFTRDSLPQEVSSSWSVRAIRANAVLIRNVARYFQQNPESNDPAVCNPTGQFFHLRTTRIQGWAQGRGATEGNVNNMTNNQVTYTGGEVLLKNNQNFFSPFNDCLQNETLRLANLGYTYIQILTDSSIGIYSVARCGYAQHTNLTVANAYNFTDSMMNGTVPFSINGATPTSTVTPVNTAREAETYWGHTLLTLTEISILTLLG